MKSRKLLIGLVAFIIIIFLVSPARIKTRILSVTDLSVNSTQVRLTQWQNSIKIFKDYPITGVGWIDLSEIHRQYAPEGADLSFHAYNIGHFHNNYIMFLICFGIIGLVSGLYMIFRIFQIEFRIYHKFYQEKWFSALLAGCIAANFGFWINGFFDWNFGDAEPVTLLWFTLGIVLAVNKNYKYVETSDHNK